jgi:conjugative relaxase-like TrwC/TraI family protein
VAVLSIGKLTVEQSRYYERQVAQGRDDYYAGRGESPGRWIGNGSELLRVAGEVDKRGFAALMDGRHPGTGERLKRLGGRSKVAAFDLTFSAPKSVSVLFAAGDPSLSRALVESHAEAVDAALEYLEREACRVRRGQRGVQREPGGGFVAAGYRHRMSRAEDPQLHTHVVTANMARGADGRWTALDATPIYQHARAAGFLYQAHLRAAVRERLPWVRWGPVRRGMAELEQVPAGVLREFSTRRRQIEERERELAEAGVEVGRSGREAIAHDTRERKRYGIDTAPWREVVRARAAEHGLGARELRTMMRGPEPPHREVDVQALGAALAGAAGLTEKQNTFARRDAVMAWAAAHGQGGPAVAVERAAREFLTRPDVHDASDPSERRFTTSDLLAHEEAIVRGAQARRGEGAGRLDRDIVDAAIASAPFAATAEQATAIRGMTSSGHGVETVEALAGTGKTFTAGLLARAYEGGDYRVIGTAPTARAVRELKDGAGIAQAFTLTRLALDLEGDAAGFGTRPTVLIVDEAGMASTRETARVLEHARAGRVKVIAIGDSGQLSSVQAGGWLASLTRRLGSHELRQVMRQRDPRERQLLAQLRRGESADYIADKMSRGHLHVYDGDGDSALGGERAAIAAWRERQATCEWGQAVLVARDNARRRRLNGMVRAELKRDGQLGDSIQVGGEEFAVGDRVVARRNDRLRAVDNGMRGTVIAIDPTEKDVIVRTDAGAHRTLDSAYVTEHLQHAYALTAHTIQGGTVEWAGVVGRPSDFTRNWSYTALSRAREATELFLIDSPTEHQLARAEIAPEQPSELGDPRTALERLEAAMRERDDEALALDRVDSTAADTNLDRGAAADGRAREHAQSSVEELRAELSQIRQQLGNYPAHIDDRIHAARGARNEAQRAADDAGSRVADLERQTRGAMRRRSPDLDAQLALERERLKLAAHQLRAATDREDALASQAADPNGLSADRRMLDARAAKIEAELPAHRRKHLRRTLDNPARYLTVVLGARPNDPRARQLWDRAAQRIETYRFDHGVATFDDALGPRPDRAPARSHWQRAHQELDRAQRELGRRTGHRFERELHR